MEISVSNWQKKQKSKLTFFVGVNLNATFGADGKPALKNLTIEEFKDVKIYLQGLGPLDKLVKFIGENFLTAAKSKAVHVITGIVRPILDQQLKNFKMSWF